jgi:phosphoglycerol transferase MdoB-like AlkP superfamily enzyme
MLTFTKARLLLAPTIWYISTECMRLLLLGSGTLFIFAHTTDFEITQAQGIRWGAILFSLSPVYCLYALLLFLMRAHVALCLSFMLTGLCIAIHRHKLALMGTPLTWTDIHDYNMVMMAINFIPIYLRVIGLMMMSLLLIKIYPSSRDRIKTKPWTSYILHTVAILLISLVACQPYHARISPLLAEKSAYFLARSGILYFSWDWPENIRQNGLPMHLVQTSMRTIPTPATPQEQQGLSTLPFTTLKHQRPKHIFFILCEACWYDDTHFKDAVAPLSQQGLVPIRGISPVYGGGTANAAFEMLTSLPAQGALQGIIYQEYAHLFSPNAITLPALLKQQGYQTLALHNFHRTFWQRHIVMRKLGFTQFHAIEDMDYAGPMDFPRDTVLYEKALTLFKQHQEQSLFFNLETVYTHAEFKPKNDHGQHDYAARLATSMKDMAAFIGAVKAINPAALFVVYGDHKPILTKYFYDEGILPDQLFLSTGKSNGDFVLKHSAPQEVVGDIPVWIGTGDSTAATSISTAANGQALYCLSAIVDHVVLGSQHPAARFAYDHVCRSHPSLTYSERVKMMPAWLYAHTLFKQ